MAARTVTGHRPRNKPAVPKEKYETEPFLKDAVLLRKVDGDDKKFVLDEILEAEGASTFVAKLAALNYRGTGMLHRALKGGAVSPSLISTVRRRFPDIPYERIFTEGQAVGARKVQDHAANLAA